MFGVLVAALLVLMPGFAHAASAVNDVEEKSSSLVFGLFLGVMLTASAYLFFIWVVMRDRGQVFLMFLLLCLSVNIASTNDLLMNQMGFYSANTRILLSTYSMIFSCIFSVFFTYYFLEIEVNNPMFRVPLFSMAGLFFLLLLCSVFNSTLVGFTLPALSTLTIAVILASGSASLRQGVSGSFTHIIAFTFFLAGTLSEPLYNLGYIVRTASSKNLTYTSYSMAALMFAIVIASQFAARQEEKEKALATSNERFTLATRGANEGLFDWNLETGEVFFSDQFRKIIGHRLENTAASLKLWMRMMVPSDRRIVREAIRRFRRNPNINTINIEYRVVSQPNDQKRWLHSKAVATRDAHSKRIIRLVGSTSDITARKQSEVALRVSEARFRSITEAHPVPVLIVSLKSQVVLYASPGAEQLLGSPQSKLMHDYIDRFLPDLEARRDIIETMSKGDDIDMKEVVLDRGDGSKLEAALSARRISYQNEDAMVLGLYDLSERKRAEAQIARQQEALQQSEKMAALGGLLAGVAHELNNPLSVVVGQATLLMEGSTEPKIVARGEKIFKAADRCARIVKSFLALARRKPPERKPVKLNELVTSALELLGFQIRTGEIEIDMNLEAALPEITGDGDQLTQVVTNLVLNAAQAMEGWQGKKRIGIRTWHDADGQVLMGVSDSGPGVPPDIRTRVFEPFFTTKSNKGGTGVGLSLCLNIIASHGGQMMLEDTPGGGATFIISLPMSEAAAQGKETGSIAGDAMPQNIRMLLVDDEVELAQTLADLLEPEGHIIDIAANGAIALEKLHKGAFDVIISDLRMPVMDGPALYEALGRELPSYLDKIIYVTGDTLSSHVQTFLSEHPVPVVEKPYRLADIRRSVTALLNGEHPPATAKPQTETATAHPA
ncbi:MAG TPA: ATP-binding protein [Alphaproteobacteria bacterium]|nr:ATP-binding protein [Alphaproteobacteria bacterium]